jgi:hypothetical protein
VPRSIAPLLIAGTCKGKTMEKIRNVLRLSLPKITKLIRQCKTIGIAYLKNKEQPELSEQIDTLHNSIRY